LLFNLAPVNSDHRQEGAMNAKRLVIGTFVGAVTLSATGYLIFGIALPNFYTNFMNAGSATGVERQPLLLWAVALAMLSYSLLVTLAIGSRAGSLDIGGGMRIGAIVSFLLWFAADFMLYGISNVGNLTGTVVDPLLELVPGAIAGGVIAVVLGKIPVAKIPVASLTRHSSNVTTGRAS
jgi:hypothetical protein